MSSSCMHMRDRWYACRLRLRVPARLSAQRLYSAHMARMHAIEANRSVIKLDAVKALLPPQYGADAASNHRCTIAHQHIAWPHSASTQESQPMFDGMDMYSRGYRFPPWFISRWSGYRGQVCLLDFKFTYSRVVEIRGTEFVLPQMYTQ